MEHSLYADSVLHPPKCILHVKQSTFIGIIRQIKKKGKGKSEDTCLMADNSTEEFWQYLFFQTIKKHRKVSLV